MGALHLSFRMLARDWQAGELRILLAALLIAVVAVSGVGFFIDRIEVALSREASHLLGADLVLRADHLPAERFRDQAARQGLQSELTITFPSMVIHAEQSQLAEIKAVGPAYPLRGKLRLARALPGVAGTPQPGSAWADERLLSQLGLKPGDRIALGQSSLVIAAVLAEEPDRAGDFFHVAPRLLINISDLAATGLIQEGSRAVYRLLLAGEDRNLSAYRDWAGRVLGRGESLEGLSEARPEVRTALERAQRYLGLAALMSVVLAGVAISLALRRYVARHLDGCAVMRCLGASQGLILRIYLWQFFWMGLVAGAMGVLLGYLAHLVIAQWLSGLLATPLPSPSWRPAALGGGVCLGMLLGFALLPLLQLHRVPTLRVLRREPEATAFKMMPAFMLVFVMLAWLVVLLAGDLMLGLVTLSVIVLLALLAFVMARLLAAFARRINVNANVSWRYGVANIGRRGANCAVQIAAFGLAGMALLSLTMVREDLMQSWLAKISPLAPNRFVINIQPDQVGPLRDFFAQKGVAPPDIFPMVRGRLVAINGKPISPADFTNERSRRMVEREFNLSWSAMPPIGNAIMAGSWWHDSTGVPAQFSVEQGIAQILKLRLGDRLTYAVAGSQITATVSNLRAVEWDSFRVNFFVLASPGVLEQFPVSYITSFFLPPAKNMLGNKMLQQFPNLTMIDVTAVVGQLRGILDKAAYAMEFVFLFMLAAGVTLLYAAIGASYDERSHAMAIWRALGASRKQVLVTSFAEFAAIGALAGGMAAIGASGLQYALGKYILHLPVELNYWLLPAAILAGAVFLGLAGLAGVWRLIHEAPLVVLRRA